MRKKNKLYTANRWNQPLFAQNVDREHNNIFDGFGSSNLGGWPTNTEIDAGRSINGNWPTVSSSANGGYSKLDLAGNYNPYASYISPSVLSKADLGLVPKVKAPTFKTSSNKSTGNFFNSGLGKSVVAGGLAAVDTIDLGDKYKRGVWDAADPLYHLAGGRESKIGNGLSDAGVSVFKAGAQSGNGWTMLAGGIMKGAGSLYNALGGIKTDKEAEESANKAIDYYSNYHSDASSFDDIEDLKYMGSFRNPYKGGVFSKGSANRKNQRLKNKFLASESYADRSFKNNITNLETDQMRTAMQDYSTNYNVSAFGGPLGGNQGAVDYGFMSDYLNAKNKAVGVKDRMPGNIFGSVASPASELFALGGDVQTNGSDFTNGLTQINAGGSHEQNPYQGVQVGISQENGNPNLVEEGETIFNDYVFSKRIKIDNKTKKKFHLSKHAKLSYADLSKRLQRESAERPNDAISQQGLSMQMQALAEEQERQKAEMQAKKEEEEFESLPPEQQQMILQSLAEQEQQAQQAEQEQQLQEQQAMQGQQGGQQVPEEQMQQQAPQEQMPQEAMQEEQGYACGGKINRFDDGGDIAAKRKKELYNAIGNVYTDIDFNDWAKKNKVDAIKDWENIWNNQQILDALGKTRPDLVDAISRGYDFGNYTAPKVRYNLEDFAKQLSEYTKSKTVGNTDGNYAVDNAFDLGSHKTIKDLENDTVYKGFTDYMTDILNRAKDVRFRYKEDAPHTYENLEFADPDNKLSEEDYNALHYGLQAMIDGTAVSPDGKPIEFYQTDDDGYSRFIDKAADKFYNIRNDGKGGIFHFSPKAINTDSNIANYEIRKDNSIVPIYGDIPKEWKQYNNYSWQSPEGQFTANYYKRPETIEAEQNGNKKNWKLKPIHRSTIGRDIGVAMPLVELGMRQLGVGKPDFSDYDNLVSSYASNAPRYAHAKPIGNKLTFTPYDINYDLNKLTAMSNATNRAIQDNSSPIATKTAGMVANTYANQLAASNALRQANEYNNNWGAKVKDFNRITDEFNAQAFNRASEVNAGIDNNRAWQLANLRMNRANERANSRAAWYKGIYNDISNFGTNKSDLGFENANHNMLADMIATGIFGTIKNQPIGTDFVKVVPVDENGNEVKKKKIVAANGGKLRRKKRGLTF